MKILLLCSVLLQNSTKSKNQGYGEAITIGRHQGRQFMEDFIKALALTLLNHFLLGNQKWQTVSVMVWVRK